MPFLLRTDFLVEYPLKLRARHFNNSAESGMQVSAYVASERSQVRSGWGEGMCLAFLDGDDHIPQTVVHSNSTGFINSSHYIAILHVSLFLLESQVGYCK